MNKLILVSAVLFATSTAAIADGTTTSKAKSAAKPAAIICPISGEKIASIKDAMGHSTYKGKTYYFCCPMCKPTFDKDPAKAVKDAAAGKYPGM